MLPSGFKSLKMNKKWEKYAIGTREESKAIFKKSEANYQSSTSCVFCVAPLLMMFKEHL